MIRFEFLRDFEPFRRFEIARDRARLALRKAGVPAVLMMPVHYLPGYLGAAEYACKMQFHQAPLFVLDQLELDCDTWIAESVLWH